MRAVGARWARVMLTMLAVGAEWVQLMVAAAGWAFARDGGSWCLQGNYYSIMGNRGIMEKKMQTAIALWYCSIIV